MGNKDYFPNQRTVRINKTKVEKSSGLAFACIYKENILDAMCNLKNSTFKVWLYLASNKNNYQLEYSPAYLSKVIKISIQTAKNAFNELKEKGYLIKDETSNYKYDFYEKPLVREEVREILNPYTGEYMFLTYQSALKMFGVIQGIKLWGDSYENENND